MSSAYQDGIDDYWEGYDENPYGWVRAGGLASAWEDGWIDAWKAEHKILQAFMWTAWLT